jgi:signal transduction histidine kinase
MSLAAPPTTTFDTPTPSPEAVLRAEAMLMLADLLGGVMHELNNPLSAVLGQAQLLRERASSDPVGLDRLARSAERLAGLGRSFVQLARESSPEGAALSINVEVQQTLPFFAYPLALRQVALEVAYAPLSAVLRARPRDLRLLVVGLVAPALECLGRGAILKVATTRPRTGWANIEVSSPGFVFDVSSVPRVLGSAGRGGPSVFLAEQLCLALGGRLSVGP